MRITIEAETDDEKKTMTEPWVRTNVQRLCVAGRSDPKLADDFEFGFIHGPWLSVKSELARLTLQADNRAQHEMAVHAVLNARNVIASQQQIAAVADQVVNQRNGRFPRIQQ